MEPHPGLLDPAQARDQAPDTFIVLFETTAGDFEVDVTRDWAPLGADRFYNLVRIGYYDDVAFFRVLTGFMAQTGINGDPAVNAVWSQAQISDDPVTQSNIPGRVTFATAGPNTRTTQIFFNFGNNDFLDGQGFAPFGMVRDMTTLNAVYADYGEGAPQGNGPNQGRIQQEGNAYLRRDFPELDYIVEASIVE
jgi:peptidyl-prolyl cis-trans isomerase A (cyclophilin A)